MYITFTNKFLIKMIRYWKLSCVETFISLIFIVSVPLHMCLIFMCSISCVQFSPHELILILTKHRCYYCYKKWTGLLNNRSVSRWCKLQESFQLQLNDGENDCTLLHYQQTNCTNYRKPYKLSLKMNIDIIITKQAVHTDIKITIVWKWYINV